MTLLRLIAVASFALLAAGWDLPSKADEDAAAGNRAFARGEYQRALEAYRRALDGRDGEAALQYDLGTALYKLAESDQDPGRRAELLAAAEVAFRRGADTRNALLKSRSYYNLGNTLYQQERFEEAIGAYRRALRSNPDHDDARYNLELALRRQSPPRGRQPAPSGQGQEQPGPSGTGQRPGPAGDDRQPGEGSQEPPQPEQPPDRQQAEEPRQDADGERPGDASGEQQGDADAEQQDADAEQQGDAEGDSQSDDGDGASEPNDPGRDAVDGDGRSPRSDAERKLDALERRSRQLRRESLRRGSRGDRETGPRKDW